MGDRCCCPSCLHTLAPDTESKLYTLSNRTLPACDLPSHGRGRPGAAASTRKNSRQAPGFIPHDISFLLSVGSRSCRHGDRAVAVGLCSSLPSRVPPGCWCSGPRIKGYGDGGRRMYIYLSYNLICSARRGLCVVLIVFDFYIVCFCLSLFQLVRGHFEAAI